jgi:hypothetical protein
MGMEDRMTAYETGRYEMFKRVCRFGDANRQFFPDGSDARKTFALVGRHVSDLDGYARGKEDALKHGWRRKAEARKALTTRLRALARIAFDEGRRTPGADARFPFPTRGRDRALLTTGQLFVRECENARDMFLRYGMPETFVADLRTLVDAFEDTTNRGWQRRTTIVVTRQGTARALAHGLDAVRTLDVIVGNALAHEPTLMAVWRDIRRNDSRRQTRAQAARTSVDAVL